VDLFFVLSGLLMADIAARRWPGTRTFLARSALRIYPAYLAAGALALGGRALDLQARHHRGQHRRECRDAATVSPCWASRRLNR
jgi:peptidoglycan/LPS O-acetylase OafA/YrhL